MHRKCRHRSCQLPITGSAHKARVVADADVATSLALLGVAAERGRTAGFDGGHDTPLTEAQMTGPGRAVSGTVAAEDIRHLQPAAHVTRTGKLAHTQV